MNGLLGFWEKLNKEELRELLLIKISGHYFYLRASLGKKQLGTEKDRL